MTPPPAYDAANTPTGPLTEPTSPLPPSLEGDSDETTTSLLSGSDATTTGVDVRSAETPGGQAQATARAVDGPLSAGQAFGSRYHIIRALGVGGMGAVYQAWDAELGVAVAMKVIRPDIMADPAAAAEVQRRFKRELLLARQVTHKNVVRIHDLGEIEGIKYITMTYVDGADLATTLKQQGTIPIRTVMRMARDVVSGLVEAHKAGVVHRDLKPANIMIATDGEAFIMDFGIARSTSRAGSVAGPVAASLLPSGVRQTAVTDDATRFGAIVGTVEYMAPEQAKGHEADHRADIYAIGLILYDMVGGRHRRAQHADSAIAELRSRMEQPPPPVRSIAPDVPEALDRLISRCLEPDPDNRYQTTAELAAALNRLDDNGVPIPIRRVVGMPILVAIVLLLVSLSAGTWWYLRRFIPDVPHDPVSVLIADFQNQTGDPAFDRTLESVLKLALEGSGFITAYDRTGVTALGAARVEKLDDRMAQQIAVKQGVGVVITGTLQRAGNGYGLSVKVTEPVTGKVTVAATNRASAKDQVIAVTTKVATTIREALGDKSSTSQLFAMDTLSATSLDVVHDYAVANLALADAKSEEALQGYSRAVQRDSTFGMGYLGMGLASRNLGRHQDAERYIKEALRHVDRMTERERYRTRGFFYRVTGDYQACVREYGDMIARYSADVAARNMRALCSTFLRKLPQAVEEMRQVVKIVPRQRIFRNNLSVYLAYSGDFAASEKEALAIENPSHNSVIALAFAQLGQGKLSQATATYGTLASMGARGASQAASGLADLAVYEGRFSDAAQILREGAAADLATKESERAAAKFAALGRVYVLRKQHAAAVAAAEHALKNSRTVKIRFLAARTLAEAGEFARAKTVAASLASELQGEPQAHAKIVEGLILLAQQDAARAIKALTEANGVLDTWIGHFDLGRAYLAARQYIQADSEFDRCIKRRGEALSLFLDEELSYSYFPPVYYYQGRVREGLNSAGFAESYREYLKIRGGSHEDPLLPDVRRRAGG